MVEVDARPGTLAGPSKKHSVASLYLVSIDVRLITM